MSKLNWLDFAIIAIISFSALVSLIRGFVREALSLVVWGCAFWVGFSFAQDAAIFLKSYIHEGNIRMVTAFVILFILTLFLGGMVNLILSFIIEQSGLSGTDRVIGVLFGIGRGILLVSISLLVLQMTPVARSDKWKTSLLVPTFQPLEKWLISYLPKETDFNKQQFLPKLTTN